MKNFPIYNTTQTKTQYKIQYLFESIGKESIVKAIEYSIIDYVGGVPVFNLGFGDYDEENDSFHDDVNSNNGDHYTVFNTVLNTVPEFFKNFPNSTIMVGGSDSDENFREVCMKSCRKNCKEECKNSKRRIKVYRYFVNKNFEMLNEDYIFFGRTQGSTFVEYIPENEYDQILVYRKK